MRRALRENAPCALMVAAGCAVMGWLGLYGFAWNDYDVEVRPAYEALAHGHLLDFLRLAPAYGGSLVERAPFALLAEIWGGGPLAVYRMVALPCLLAGGALAVWLVAHLRARGATRLARAVAAAVCVANPLTLRALELGHPEELLGGSLCVIAVLLAARSAGGRPLLAGLALGLAIANKEWALLALPPVLLALPAGRRLRCLGVCAATAGAILAPLILASSGGFLASTRATAAPAASPIFQPWQLWWFLGHHGAAVHGLFGVAKPGYRVGPGWTGTISHPLVLTAGLLIGLALWARSRGGRLPAQQALLALALVLLLRCLLDTWDAVYYPLPFVLALLAWEVESSTRRPPTLALGASVLFWVSFQSLASRVSPDLQAAFFIAWTLPLAAWLGARLAGPSPADGRSVAQETTVRPLGRLVSTS